ncbi:unnamed protein product [Mytilus coruscus]|uniref:Reverse transcriptase RNase H-like domain-containing protein n=1 Tax=Mytilus coruscus TaxID=42192 RepID=A0A6J8A2R1_MYTCO|nr:unnamed protein product [Mytilus coruscus]
MMFEVLLGLCNHYRKFVKGYAKIESPLNTLLTKDTPFKWTTDCQNAFETLKEALTSTPVLNFPNFNKPFIVSCDAYGSAIGYILPHVGDDEKEHVIGYGGRALTPAEKNYTVTEQEMQALVSAVAYFHVYLATNKFTIYTDHKALTWLQTIKHTNSRLIRWALKLQEYTFEVIHRLGSRNQNCDVLSRGKYEKQSEQTNVLTEVTFIYPGETLEQVTNSVKEVPIFSLEDISSLQKQCPYFGPIITFLENGTLLDDKKRAQAIPYETSQYELLNDTLYHFFQPRTKTRTSKHQLIKQVAIPEPLRNDILLSFHDQKAVENRHDLIYKLLKTLRPIKSFIHENRLKAYKDPNDFRPPPNLLKDNEALNNDPSNINKPNPDNLNDYLNQAENQEDNSQSDVDESTSDQGMSRFGFVTLPFLLFALLLSTSNADEQRINYGIIFQNQPNNDFTTDYWTHIYEIPMYLNLQHKLVTKCPQGADRQCQSYDKIFHK